MADFQGDRLYRSRSQIVSELVQAMQIKVPDVWVGNDGNLMILFEVEAGQVEGLFLANQLTRDDIFIATCGIAALELHGAQWAFPKKQGARAEGEVLITGAAGTFIPIGAQFSTSPSAGTPLYFSTTEEATLPNTGVPTAPTAADAAAGGNLTGLMQYTVTFLTDQGETTQGLDSNAVSVTASQINLSSIPIGGAGTTGRRIYRSKDGGAYKLVTTISNNTTTTFTDNVADGALTSEPPAVSTAERALVAAESDEPGERYNVQIATIIDVTDAPTGISEVTNPAPFEDGIDPEDNEEYRLRLIGKIRTPETGSESDLELWAEEVDGVEEATCFPNDNLGTAAPGHATVRISGPNGTIPDAEVVAEVQETLDEKDMANIIIHVATFTPVVTNVTVDVTLLPNYTLPEVTPSVQAAVEDYIYSVPVGGTVYVAGITDAVFGLSGIADVVVTTPGSNQPSTAPQKRVPGTVTVT